MSTATSAGEEGKKKKQKRLKLRQVTIKISPWYAISSRAEGLPAVVEQILLATFHSQLRKPSSAPTWCGVLDDSA